jgi:hypothetical protein
MLRMGPEGYGGKCEPSYNGDVTLAYSTNIGRTWFDIGTYQAVLYNTGPFFHISVALPEQGWSNTTRFKFYQVTKPPATHACMPSQLSHLTKALPFGFAIWLCHGSTSAVLYGVALSCWGFGVWRDWKRVVLCQYVVSCCVVRCGGSPLGYLPTKVDLHQLVLVTF